MGQLIFGLKFRATGDRGEADLRLASAGAVVDPHVAMPINVLRDLAVFPPARAVAHLDLHSPFHSFRASLSSSAAKASSSFIRSQIVRPSIRFGFGIRPSSTISSNLVVPTPTYSADCTRDRPRGGRLSGRQLAVRDIALLALLSRARTGLYPALGSAFRSDRCRSLRRARVPRAPR